VATDTIHGAFLVTWEYFTEGLIFGRRVFANGTIDGAAFEISTTTAGDQTETPRAAFDPDNDRWLVVWSDMRSGTGRYLYGRFVGSDGAPQGEDLTLYDAGRVRDGNGGVAHSPQDSQFLVAVTPSSGGSLLALRVDASTGAVTGDRVPLGSGVAPEVAFSQVSGKYLVAWIDDTVVRGQTVAPDGTVGVEHQYMTVTDGTPANVAVVAHHTVERFAVVGDRWGTDDSIWGRYVDANDGAAVGTTFLASDPSRAPDWNGAALNTVNHGIAIGSYDLDAGEPFVSYIVGLCFAGSPATTSEDGSSATIEVQLCAAPTGDVLVNVASGNTNEGTVSPASLTFSPANWQTPQAVTVTPIGDGIVDGDTEYRVSFAVDDANSADDYDGVIDAVWITNTNVDLLDDGSGSPSAPDGGCNCRAQPQPALLLVALAGTLLTRRSRRRRLSPHR
jgi:MYXO-CTERM domain-containing protein